MSASFTEAVTFASPAATAVTVPVSSTVATLSSEEVHSMVSFSAALATFSSVAALSPVAAVSGVTAGASSVPYTTDRVILSPFSTIADSGTAMFVIFTPHPTRVSAIAAAATTAKMIVLRFIFNFSFTSRRLVPGPH